MSDGVFPATEQATPSTAPPAVDPSTLIQEVGASLYAQQLDSVPLAPTLPTTDLWAAPDQTNALAPLSAPQIGDDLRADEAPATERVQYGSFYDGQGVFFAVRVGPASDIVSVRVELLDALGNTRIGHDHFLMEQSPTDASTWTFHKTGLRPGQMYRYAVERKGESSLYYALDPMCHAAKISRHAIDQRSFGSARPDSCVNLPLSDPETAPTCSDTPFNDGKLLFDEINRRNGWDTAMDPVSLVPLPDNYQWKSSPPETPGGRAKSITYETHVINFTRNNPDIPQEDRGTYAGVASDASIRHLKRLGVTEIELMPTHLGHDFCAPAREGGPAMPDHWNYMPVSQLARHLKYTKSKDPLLATREVQEMVDKLHANGIRVRMDVVWNHDNINSGLGNLDPRYYCRNEDGSLFNGSDCGNVINFLEPSTRELFLDQAARHYKLFHADLRLDLADFLDRDDFMNRLAALGRQLGFDIDAEPWSPCGHKLKDFPKGVAEWNDQYRIMLRTALSGGREVPTFKPKPGEPESLPILAMMALRQFGSSDLFESAGRNAADCKNTPWTHDGPTALDSQSYKDAGEIADNCGVEGPTDNPGINAWRKRRVREGLTDLLLARGQVLINGFDEAYRSTGDKNPYNQDNKKSWYDWNFTAEQKNLIELVATLTKLRAENDLITEPNYSAVPVEWIGPGAFVDLQTLSPQRNRSHAHSVDWRGSVMGQLLGNQASIAAGQTPIYIVYDLVDHDYANDPREPAEKGTAMCLPALGPIGPDGLPGKWEVVLRSADERVSDSAGISFEPGETYMSPGRCTTVFRYVAAEAPARDFDADHTTIH